MGTLRSQSAPDHADPPCDPCLLPRRLFLSGSLPHITMKRHVDSRLFFFDILIYPRRDAGLAGSSNVQQQVSYCVQLLGAQKQPIAKAKLNSCIVRTLCLPGRSKRADPAQDPCRAEASWTPREKKIKALVFLLRFLSGRPWLALSSNSPRRIVFQRLDLFFLLVPPVGQTVV